MFNAYRTRGASFRYVRTALVTVPRPFEEMTRYSVRAFAAGEMAIEAHSQIGDVYEKLDIQQEGANLNIAFNVKYLTDVVRFIDAEQIELNMNNAVSPCVITPVGDEDYLHLVLPVRTGATN